MKLPIWIMLTALLLLGGCNRKEPLVSPAIKIAAMASRPWIDLARMGLLKTTFSASNAATGLGRAVSGSPGRKLLATGNRRLKSILLRALTQGRAVSVHR